MNFFRKLFGLTILAFKQIIRNRTRSILTITGVSAGMFLFATVETMQEAMQLIDDHEYGNGTCIFTRDGEAARYFADNIQVYFVFEIGPPKQRTIPG